MSILRCDYQDEDAPTLDQVKTEIMSIVGLRAIKKQLEAVVEKILDAKKHALNGFRVVSPKPFHMVFIGNSGTGKSMVARIVGKLFYLAGSLSSYTVTEMKGNRKMKNAGGGVLVVNIDEDPTSSKTFEDIIALMDKGDTSVIFAGNRKSLNECLKYKSELFRRFSVGLQFDDLTPFELAKLLEEKASDTGEKDLTCGLQLDSSCITCNIAQVIADVTPENQRRQLNAHLLDQMLIETVKAANMQGETEISLTLLGTGIENASEIYENLLSF